MEAKGCLKTLKKFELIQLFQQITAALFSLSTDQISPESLFLSPSKVLISGDLVVKIQAELKKGEKNDIFTLGGGQEQFLCPDLDSAEEITQPLKEKALVYSTKMIMEQLLGEF